MKVVWRSIIALFVAGTTLGIAATIQQSRLGLIETIHRPAGRFVNIPGGRLHIVELGETGRPAVVLLHGSSTNLEDMHVALGNVLSTRYHVILVDRPGHGWSDRPDGAGDASPRRQAELIHDAVTKIGIARAILVGHSWAGSVALAYGLAYPKDVAGLVLLAPLAFPRPPTVAWPDDVISVLLSQSARIAEAPVFGALFSRTLLYPLGKLLLSAAVRDAFAPQKPPPHYIERTAAELLLRPAAFIANGEDLAAIDRFLAVQSESYARLAVPTAIIAGDADAIVASDTNAEELSRRLPNATLTLLRGIGHMVHYEAQDRVMEAIGAMADHAPSK